nr:50S ribosomal protein L4 [Candidatus Njordarchaeum guaymaensis]
MTKTVNVLNLEGNPVRKIPLPEVFETPPRPDLVQRAVLASLSAQFHRHGVDTMAGKRTTAYSRGPGMHLARVPRKRGTLHPEAMAGAFAPMTVGGRLAHPPRVEKRVKEFINKKERRLALRSAIALTSELDLVKKRGHLLNDEVKALPIVCADDIEKIASSREARDALVKLGVWPDVLRVSNGKKVRSGAGKRRGRKYKVRRGPLMIVAKTDSVAKAMRNLGVNVVTVSSLGVKDLAPGGDPGRLTIWSEAALNKLKTFSWLGSGVLNE